MSGHTPCWTSRRHSRAMQGANASAHSFNSFPGSPSGPVALSGSMFLRIRLTQRALSNKKPESSEVGEARTGWCSGGGGNWHFSANVFASNAAFSAGVNAHEPSFVFSGGMDDTDAVLLSNSRLIFHHCLEERGNEDNLVHSRRWYARNSSAMTASSLQQSSVNCLIHMPSTFASQRQ